QQRPLPDRGKVGQAHKGPFSPRPHIDQSRGRVAPQSRPCLFDRHGLDLDFATHAAYTSTPLFTPLLAAIPLRPSNSEDTPRYSQSYALHSLSCRITCNTFRAMNTWPALGEVVATHYSRASKTTQVPRRVCRPRTASRSTWARRFRA